MQRTGEEIREGIGMLLGGPNLYIPCLLFLLLWLKYMLTLSTATTPHWKDETRKQAPVGHLEGPRD